MCGRMKIFVTTYTQKMYLSFSYLSIAEETVSLFSFQVYFKDRFSLI